MSEVRTEFVEGIGGARLAGVIAGCCNAACQRAARVFKPAYIISLPAVQREGDLFNGRQDTFGVHAESSISLFREVISGLSLRFGRSHTRLWETLFITFCKRQ